MATSSCSQWRGAGPEESRDKEFMQGDGGPTQDEYSSDSDIDTEPAKAFHRRISTNKEIKTTTAIKEGYLMKHTSTFQGYRRKYFKLKGRKLYYAKDTKFAIFDEIDLSDLSVAECSTKNINHSFQVITPSRNLILCAESRKEMEDWIMAIKTASSKEYYDANTDHRERMSGQHNWYACSHARPTYCNVCRDALSGVTSHGLSCEVCKFKAHKKCAVKASSNCKWTSLASVGKEIIEDEDGIHMPHQWLEGNLPVSAKCNVCEKTCGSVLRLQDWRCIWCRAMVHIGCQEKMSAKCPFGQCRVSILPPIAINSMDSDGFWEATRPAGTSPLLVFVNSKSGDNQGVKFLRRFKQLLNPAQVFDLMNGGPYPGLRLFQKFNQFRILVCGGDGSIGWVLTEIDKLDIHKQCQIGVLPFGTGNDLARVLGWGSAFDDDTQLHALLEKLEHSQIKMLDRWSILTYEGTMPTPRKLSQQFEGIGIYEDSVADHLSKILHSTDHTVVIRSAKVLCETVKEFVCKVGQSQDGDGEKAGETSISSKCNILNEKLESLLKTLKDEALMVSAQEGCFKCTSDDKDEASSPERDTVPGEITGIKSTKGMIFKPREALMCRANSLKKAIRQIIEHTEKAVDEQNAQTESQCGLIQPEAALDSNILCEQSQQFPSSNSVQGLEVSQSVPTFAVYTSESKPAANAHPAQLKLAVSCFDVSSEASSSCLCVEPSGEGISSSIAGRLAGGSFISQVLLANADALCAAASPLIEEDIHLEEYTEKCVMNNYFGIGLDAKISLDFHLKREEHPEKCRSRTKNFMWYSVLGGKEILQRTFKNLDQRVQLECDGQRIPLPSLQGIVILNIPSYMGGANFWGGTKEDDNFTAPSFDDKILEVVAVFGSMQMAVSRVIDLHHHRIAQCRTVKVTIMGDEGVPVQVDGEAWMQPPGYIRIVHKNRAQMLTRDRIFENVLKTWSNKQKVPQASSPGPALVLEDEAALHSFIEVSSEFIDCVKSSANQHSALEQDLYSHSSEASERLDALCLSGKLAESNSSLTEPSLRPLLSDFVNSMKILYNETHIFLREKSPSTYYNRDAQLSGLLTKLEAEMRKIVDVTGLVNLQTSQEEMSTSEQKHRKGGKFRQVYSKLKGKGRDKERDKNSSQAASTDLKNIEDWSTAEVAMWLETLALGEYQQNFVTNEIRGSELLSLERSDLKDLGVHKVGHLKRIMQGIKELNNRLPITAEKL
ncbi:diacylglycerol kinase delta-like isoform X2 [Octopus vulgaris]|uniref:Diacylglycerol kinase n=3 Tax=Octopus TaxID=6643 RepID=A0AA36BMU5_OCTVU|nr:diacylglycerol kinase delta-like isoform X2 [Octopus vulgaris]